MCYCHQELVEKREGAAGGCKGAEMGRYLCVFLNLDLDSPCFGEEGAKEQHLKACAQRREIYINSP